MPHPVAKRNRRWIISTQYAPDRTQPGGICSVVRFSPAAAGQRGRERRCGGFRRASASLIGRGWYRARDEAERGLPRVNVTGRRNELCLRRLNLRSNAKEYAMKTIMAGIVVAATILLSAAPAFAIDVDVDPDGNRADCRRVIVEMPDGSTVVSYRCE